MRLNLLTDFNKEQYNKPKQNNPAFKGILSKAKTKIIASIKYRNSGRNTELTTEGLGLATALVATGGFGGGGGLLMYDYLKAGNKGPKIKDTETDNPLFNKTSNPLFEAIYKKHVETMVNKGPEGEFGHIEPDTKLGEIGINLAKVGVGFSGIAGMFNGIAMNVPLMTAGEAANVAASPIINTPAGFGLMSIGLAAIFAGRALENDPNLKMNPIILSSKKGLDKGKYVINNMTLSALEVLKSSKAVADNTVGLFKSSTRTTAKAFFKDHIMAIRSPVIGFAQKLVADGSAAVDVAFKSSPHRMHAASSLLALGGAIVIAGTIIKNELTKKVGFRTASTGGAFDNIGLSMYGAERALKGAPAAGVPLAISGAAILAGQPHIDKKDGRSLQWLGCGALFLTFVVDRGKSFAKVLKEASSLKKDGAEYAADKTAQLIRGLEVNLADVIPRELYTGWSKLFKNPLDTIGKAINAGSTVGEGAGSWAKREYMKLGIQQRKQIKKANGDKKQIARIRESIKEKVAEIKKAVEKMPSGKRAGVKLEQGVLEWARHEYRKLGLKQAAKIRKIKADKKMDLQTKNKEIQKIKDETKLEIVGEKKRFFRISDRKIGIKENAEARIAIEKNRKLKPALDTINTIKGVLEKGQYNTDSEAVMKEINEALTAKGGKVRQFAGKVIQEKEAGDPKEILETIHHEGANIAGEGYKGIIQKILQHKDSLNQTELGQTVVKAAKKSVQDLNTKYSS